MKQYVVCREYFSEMQREMNNAEDTYDSIAPGTQSVEHQDQVEVVLIYTLILMRTITCRMTLVFPQ